MLDDLRALLRVANSLRSARCPWPARPWICQPCRRTAAAGVPRIRRFATTAATTTTTTAAMAGTATTPKKPFYVTTPIFYVNSAPHVGHLFTMVLGDIVKRWQVVCGNESRLLTGTDEHGLKIQQAAAAAGMEPKALCDENCETFKTLAKAANVDYDYFIRTTDPAHQDAVRHCWEVLNAEGYLYLDKHEGWYSVSDEAFYPESAVQVAVEPATGRKITISIETGKEVEWASEENYHFRLSALCERLLAHYRAHPDFITPRVYMDGVVREVENGLADLSVSRPAKRLRWGIRVPADDSQTVYVWLDALVNYLSYAGYPWPPGQAGGGGLWPADVHVVGKDILRFHGIYWPAFLLALGQPLPRRILTHAHWTMNRAKMSKSAGNGASPGFALDRFGIDPLRFYLASDAALAEDSDYDNALVAERYRKSLQWGIGNLASRLLRGKRWNVRAAVERASTGGGGGGGGVEPASDAERAHLALLNRTPGVVAARMDELDPRRAVEAIMNVVFETNKYFQAAEPWKLTAANDAAALARAVYTTAESLRIAGILLQAFIPERAGALLDMLGVATERRTMADAQVGANASYGVSRVRLGKGVEGTLFPPLLSEE